MASNLLMPSWESAENAERAELVFETRNKEYGAYDIRKWYQVRLNRAFIYSTIGFVLLILSPFIIELLGRSADEETKTKSEVIVNLTEPPPVDETPPPPPPPPPQPLKETVKFTPPVVKDAPVEEDPPPQEKLSETTISTVTQEGEKTEELPPEEPVDPDAGKIFTVVEEQPSFPGGEAALFKYLYDNLKYPPIARENGIVGTIYVNFVVDKDGKVKDPKIIRGGLGGGLEEEALRVVRTMPDWKPGRQNGHSVAVYCNLPIKFTLK
jgi:periplasmic protein TonB